MGDTMKKVQTGDPMVVPASTYNAFIDAATDLHQRQPNATQDAKAAGDREGVVLIKNDSGADRLRFEVLGIDGPVYSPTDNPEGFKNDIVLKGIVPTEASHRGRFVILAEPLADGNVGHAFVSGVCVAKVNITNEGHRFADVEDNQPGRLKAFSSGAATILWVESSTGVKWAIVQMGTATAMTVYGWYSNHTTDGQYNCRLMSWASGSWSAASSVIVVCKVTKETSGHAFGSGDLFLATGPADANGVIPVTPMFYAYAK